MVAVIEYYHYAQSTDDFSKL